MKSKNTSKNNSKETTKDLFIAAFFTLVFISIFISPLVLLFSPFYESKGELSRFLAKKTAQREKNEKEEFIIEN